MTDDAIKDITQAEADALNLLQAPYFTAWEKGDDVGVTMYRQAMNAALEAYTAHVTTLKNYITKEKD